MIPPAPVRPTPVPSSIDPELAELEQLGLETADRMRSLALEFRRLAEEFASLITAAQMTHSAHRQLLARQAPAETSEGPR